ncbi:MAG: hypothetical protein JNN07_17680 [Verrucomicrobiales bacterium]|nr:hypothetical protein [Verrucomicrobiales bacterium]
MKTIHTFTSLLTGIAIIAMGQSPVGAEQAEGKESKKAKPYPLKTCLVSDETLDADPSMKSYSFVHEGQEVKLCCKSCLKDFKKNPAKLLKKMKETADKEAKKSAK